MFSSCTYYCFCFVGQRICSVGEGNVADSGTYVRDSFIYASLAGCITRVVSDDKMVTESFLSRGPGAINSK